jgi:hypothetical protein
MTVPPDAPNIATSHANHGPPRIRRTASPLRNPNVQNSERLHGEGCWPHPRVHSLSRVGSGATVDTLKTGYPHIQALSQRRKARQAHIPACPAAPVSWQRVAPEPQHASWLWLPPLGPAAAPGPPHALWPRLPSLGMGQLWDRRVPRGSSSRHQGPRQLCHRHMLACRTTHISRHRAAPEPPCASWLQLLPPGRAVAPGRPRPVAPAPVSWHRTAPGPPHVLWARAVGCGLLK